MAPVVRTSVPDAVAKTCTARSAIRTGDIIMAGDVITAITVGTDEATEEGGIVEGGGHENRSSI